jgi:hypothetical protein
MNLDEFSIMLYFNLTHTPVQKPTPMMHKSHIYACAYTSSSPLKIYEATAFVPLHRTIQPPVSSIGGFVPRNLRRANVALLQA